MRRYAAWPAPVPDLTLLHAIYLSQAGMAAVLAGLLAWFNHLYRHTYLRYWTESWAALGLHLIGASAGLWLSLHAPDQTGLRLLVATVSQASGQLQLGLLLVGAAELRRGDRVPTNRVGAVLAAFAMLGVTTALVHASLPAASELRQFLRAGVRGSVAAAAFAIAAGWVARSQVWPRGAGGRIVAFGFGGYALDQFQYFVGSLASLAGGPELAYLAYLSFVDLVFQAIIGFGMVVGLLEQERARAVVAAEEVERLSYHDASTGLPNRRMLVDFFSHAIARARRTGERLAVAHINVDQFRTVSEAWSPAMGDVILRGIGDRMRVLLREADLVAHLGADSFGVLLGGYSRDAELVAVAERLAQRIRQPFVIHGREIQLTPSIGIACYPQHGTDAAALLRAAGAALYRAKESGRNSTVFYEPVMDERARERALLERGLRRAIGGDELMLYYQPIVEMRTGRIVRFEALLRWRHPERGLMMPTEFLPVIDAIGLSDAVDQWVLRSACTDARLWRERLGGGPRVAVNLSAYPVQDQTLVNRIETVLGDTGLPASALEIEVTESAAMQHAEGTLATLRGLRRLGVHVAIDDFGTGYSSLSYLRTFPIDAIKVDRAFVRDLGQDENARTLIAGIIALARSLELDVVAEGVETETQRAILSAEGCGYLQGFLVGAPMPASALMELVDSGMAA
ncbi:MAG TPA: bifunctional diguanylate cyclase/phosphodiesterase [Gemmatimonadales bacterium]|nr:bifunctional diguanylate cyclase/phosphodiesterase [Gemmatimonadales bacterium]